MKITTEAHGNGTEFTNNWTLANLIFFVTLNSFQGLLIKHEMLNQVQHDNYLVNSPLPINKNISVLFRAFSVVDLFC
jgi:hypothetical protein